MAGLSILVIDDAAFMRELVKKTLRTRFSGCNIVEVNSARRAQALMKTQRFDLILSDWEMPEMDGEEFLRWVRSQDGYRDTPFIMVSSRGEKEYVVKAVQAGVSDYLGKPFTPEDLTSKVTKQLKRIGKLPQAQRPRSNNAIAQETLSVLTGGSAAPATPAPAAPASAPSPAAVFAAPPAARPAAPVPNRAVAQMTLSGGHTTQALVQSVTLQAMQAVLRRSERLPQLLEAAVISIQAADGAPVARLNGYIHALEALESRMDAERIKVTVRFVDDDPAKLDQLSQFIARR